MQLPSSIQVALSGNSDFVWEPFTSDTRGLQINPTNAQRIAAAWYGDAFPSILSRPGTGPLEWRSIFMTGMGAGGLNESRFSTGERVGCWIPATSLILAGVNIACMISRAFHDQNHKA